MKYDARCKCIIYVVYKLKNSNVITILNYLITFNYHLLGAYHMLGTGLGAFLILNLIVTVTLHGIYFLQIIDEKTEVFIIKVKQFTLSYTTCK